MKEIWKPIKDYEGLYEVSNLGRVKSLRRNIIVKPYMNHTGYWMVNLWYNCKQDKRLISRLVAETFIPNPNDYPIINHIDGNKQNNHVSNLEWCTYSQNIKHAHDNGLRKIYHKKITDEQVKELIHFRKLGYSLSSLSCKYNISLSLTSMICNGKRRKKVV